MLSQFSILKYIISGSTYNNTIYIVGALGYLNSQFSNRNMYCDMIVDVHLSIQYTYTT